MNIPDIFDVNRDNPSTSVIDHFFICSKLGLLIQDAGVLHSADNRSDHSPVYCVLSSLNITLDITESKGSNPKPSWKVSTVEEKEVYKITLEERLNMISVPQPILQCKEVKCRCSEHCDLVDQLAIQVLETIQTTAEACLPCKGGGGESGSFKKIAGWTDEVKPYRDNAHFWHQIWKSCGRPVGCEVYRIMKRTRNIYHYQFKKCKKAEDIVKKNKLLDACFNNSEGDIFKEIKKLRKTKQAVANTIDGVNENISEHFKTLYSNLYNSVEDADNMTRVSIEVEDNIGEYSVDDVNKVTPEIVKEATKKLKSGKSDPVFSFSSDCIKVESDRLAYLLSVIVQSYLIHGHVTRFLLIATLVPIIKDKLGPINSSKNYRSIAISSLILKLLDWIILLLFGSSLGLNDLQYAYQPGISGSMCTYAVLETVDYYLRHGSEVFMCTMDMSKAFDVTVHSILFTKMFKAGLSTIFLRLLIFIYTQQVANVRWNGDLSDFFTMHNGVRQGAILSAIAYCFYCEELFALLESRRSGCWVNGFFLGLLGYSDDNICLAPSLNALQDMLETCESFAKSHNLRFSTDPNPAKCKTKTMAFLKKVRPLPSLILCGNPLPWTDRCKHLGTTLQNKVDGCQEDMRVKNAMYIQKNIELNQEFSFAHHNTKVSINSIFNSHYSCSPLWDLFSPRALSLESSYNKSIKIMMDLPYATHRSLIEPLSGKKPLKIVLISRFLGFMEKIGKSNKKGLIMLMETSRKDVRSVTGSNYRNIMLLTGKCRVSDVCKGDVKDLHYHKLDQCEAWKVGAIQEILQAKEGLAQIEGFEDDELDFILNYLCTD